MADTRLRADAKKTATLSITIEGARSREAALSSILDMLKPEVRAALAKVAESSNGFRQVGDSYTLSSVVCCWDDGYGICAEEDPGCFVQWPGCPA